MLVSEWMTRKPVTIAENASVSAGLRLMRDRRVRRLPVLGANGKLVGIVSEKDLLRAAPSPATSLSVYEVNYLLDKIMLSEVMSRPVITVAPDSPLEQAACIMADRKIGGLPVMDGEVLVGIITETDVFKVLVEVLGARAPGLRVALEVGDKPGVLARLAQALAERGANILSLVTYAGTEPAERRITLKVNGITDDAVREALDQPGVRILDLVRA